MDWPGKGWPDAELKGLEFLDDREELKTRWESFWPTGRGIHNWDSVGWIGAGPDRELLLVEAKAHVAEMESDCGAGPGSIQKIKRAFERVKQDLEANPDADWTKVYYQAAKPGCTHQKFRVRAVYPDGTVSDWNTAYWAPPLRAPMVGLLGLVARQPEQPAGDR